jgi:Inner membrane protein YgaP-like, transmembrane domain
LIQIIGALPPLPKYRAERNSAEAAVQANIGTVDRVVRIIVGLIFLSLVVLLKDNARWIGLVGLVPLLTGLFRWCPLYTAFGVRT